MHASADVVCRHCLTVVALIAGFLPWTASLAGPEPQIDGLVLREDGGVIATVWQGVVTGEISIPPLTTTGNIAVTWLDPDSTEFQLDPQLFELRWTVADTTVATYHPAGFWNFTMDGEQLGKTDLVLKVWHIAEMHFDFISEPIPVHCEKGHVEADGMRLRDGSEVLVTVWQGAVTGDVTVGAGRTSGPINVAFMAANGGEFIPDNPDFELQLQAANPALITFTPGPNWSFTVHGVAAGQTTFIVRVFHIDHVDWASPPIPIRVINLAVGIPEPELQAAWGGARLMPAQPNPFNPSTMLRYELAGETDVDLTVYDLEGRLVARLESGSRVAGEHVVRWNADRFPSGVYLLRLATPQDVRVQKLMLAK